MIYNVDDLTYPTIQSYTTYSAHLILRVAISQNYTGIIDLLASRLGGLPLKREVLLMAMASMASMAIFDCLLKKGKKKERRRGGEACINIYTYTYIRHRCFSE